MRKVLLVPLVFLSIFIAGCDNGISLSSKKVPSNLKVRIERQITVVANNNLTVYAMDFHKEGRTLTFVCPCHLPGSSDNLLIVRVEGDSFNLTLLPDAEYEVRVQYWTPNADKNVEVKFHISR